ncbi:putative ATP synthase F1, delta subunit [Trichinella spiralis]|uniref:putative ATP synthase F1, delta subunit n=2 Tax=Trichinella spiralis TaxID=6334 RepID=UPI0001EFE09F|nr:putative ATP synthase F1, delta subunit [Trichinella spiralis]XP_003369820.1 putative ATP synthase F1, delta subunit [Trichinella spiralis]XP_003370903.1 putative ATP synthase F1, delta subunit [Trichinella spiralis]
MRRLLDEVDVLWSHVAEADAVGDYVVTLEKISIKALDSSNKLKLSVDFEIFAVFGPEKAESLKLEKEKQLIADHLAVLDQEHDRTLGERIWDSSCVEELRKRLQADENSTF